MEPRSPPARSAFCPSALVGALSAQLDSPVLEYIFYNEMARPAKFDDEQILLAVGRLVARDGPSGATIGAIAQAVGAPIGSIYHRFDSRDVLLARVWLRAATAFQAAYFDRLGGPSPRDAGLAAALYMAERVRASPDEARVLLLHRREDFVDRGWPPAMRRQATRLGRQVEIELRTFSGRLCGRADARTVATVTYAVLGAPFAAVRRHVAANEPPPPFVDDLIRVTYEAAMALLGVSAGTITGSGRAPGQSEDGGCS
jgi:AcrR family transcriptional regulator